MSAKFRMKKPPSKIRAYNSKLEIYITGKTVTQLRQEYDDLRLKDINRGGAKYYVEDVEFGDLKFWNYYLEIPIIETKESFNSRYQKYEEKLRAYNLWEKEHKKEIEQREVEKEEKLLAQMLKRKQADAKRKNLELEKERKQYERLKKKFENIES